MPTPRKKGKAATSQVLEPLDADALKAIELAVCGRDLLEPPQVCDQEWIPLLPTKWACRACFRVWRISNCQASFTSIWTKATGCEPHQKTKAGLSYDNLVAALKDQPGLPANTDPGIWQPLLETIMQLLLMGRAHDQQARARGEGNANAWRIWDFFFDGQWLQHDESPGEDKHKKRVPNFFWHRFFHLTVPARLVELGAFYARAAQGGQRGLVINLSGYSAFYGGSLDSPAIGHIWHGFSEAAKSGATVLYVVQEPTPQEVADSLHDVCDRLRKYIHAQHYDRFLVLSLGHGPKAYGRKKAEHWPTAYFTKHWRYTGVRTGQDEAFVGIRTALRGGILHRSVETMDQETTDFWDFVDTVVIKRLSSAQPLLESVFAQRLPEASEPGET